MKNIKQVASTFRNTTVNSNKLSNMWLIIIENAKELIRTTTQTTVHDTTETFTRQLNMMQSLFHSRLFRRRVSKDTILLSVKYVQVNKAFQIFVTKFGDVNVYPLSNKGDAHKALYQ